MHLASGIPHTISSDSGDLPEVEIEVIEIFVRLGRLLGAPKSVGQIFGLLFVSPEPLALDDVIRRLAISKGSASQGLKLLRSLGAIRPRSVPEDRREHFVAETELRHLLSGLLREQVAPHLESGEERLIGISRRLSAAPTADGSQLKHRVEKLKNWHQQARQLLPLVQKAIRE